MISNPDFLSFAQIIVRADGLDLSHSTVIWHPKCLIKRQTSKHRFLPTWEVQGQYWLNQESQNAKRDL